MASYVHSPTDAMSLALVQTISYQHYDIEHVAISLPGYMMPLW